MNKKGTIFIAVMTLSLIMTIIGVSVSNMLLRDARMIRHLKQSTQAQFIAEAGISDAITTLATSGFSEYTDNGNALGDGEYDLTVDEITVDGEDRWLISSTGKVGSTTRTATMEVRNVSSEALDYTLAAGTNIKLTSNQGSITVNGDLHANNNLTLHESGSPLSVAAFGTLSGKATCSSTMPSAYKILGTVSIEDAAHSGPAKPRLNMPTFDFASFKTAAETGGGIYISSGGTYTNDTTTFTGGTVGINYVDGDVTFVGNCQITGGFVAKGDITLNNINALTQVAHATDAYPIFMSEAGNRIKLYGNFTSTDGNIIYATNNIQIETPGGGSTILGTVIAGGSFTITANDALELTYQNITAPNVQPQVIEIVSWNR